MPLPHDPSFDHSASRLSAEELSGYVRTLGKYQRGFLIPNFDKIGPFARRLHVFAPGSPEFTQKNMRDPTKPFFWKNEILFATDRLTVDGVFAAHVRSGVHLMTSFDNAVVPARPWEDFSTALEGLDVTEAVSQLLEENLYQGLPLAGKTRDTLTGSWFGPFAKVAGMDVVPGLDKKHLARGFRGPLPQSPARAGDTNRWKTKAHFHLYGARHTDEDMVHFARSIDSRDNDWLDLQPVGLGWMEETSRVLNAQLIDRLQPSAGVIVPGV